MTAAVKPIKVLVAITKANFGGAQRYVFDVARSAKEAGFDVLVAYGAPGLMAKKLHEAHIKTVELPLLGRDISPLKDLSSFNELLSLIHKERPDVLHLNSSKMGLVGALAGRFVSWQSGHKMKIIFTAHGWAFNEGRPLWQKALLAFLHYVTVILSHETLCNSEATRRDCAWMPLVQKKIRVIRLGVSPVSFMDRAAARKQLSPQHVNAFWVGMVGELHTTKGIFEAVEGFGKVAALYPDARLILMGEGDARRELEKHIHALKLDATVELLGHVSDAPQYLPALDIFLFPSRTEALGLALLEAGLARLPAIGTSVGGIPEIIEDGKTGLLISKNNPGEIASALTALMKDSGLRRRLGEALRIKVQTSFSKEEMLKRTLERYAH
jgi:glycosyltransferase involved in cell wall biosynthesis